MAQGKSTGSKIGKWVKIILISLVVASILRYFFLESYRMPSTQMENAILKGDYILVDKTAYGIRMPITLLSIPFIPDSLPVLGIKTYSERFLLPYTRLFGKKVNRNDIVIYNIPNNPGICPLDKSPTSISRCIGLPGDTIEVKGLHYYINGQRLPQNPDMIVCYEFNMEFKLQILSEMNQLGIPVRVPFSKDNIELLPLSRYEYYMLKDALSDSVIYEIQDKEDLSYKLVIPQKGMVAKLSSESAREYEQIIACQTGEKTEYRQDGLYINNQFVDYYRFENDYYWMLSDHAEASADSRHFGFIPETHLIGKASWIWLSKTPDQGFLSGYRWKRTFRKVH